MTMFFKKRDLVRIHKYVNVFKEAHNNYEFQQFYKKTYR